MFRLRSKSGDESVFRSPEEIRAALLSGFVTPDAQIWDADLKGWVPLLEHALYQQIAAAPPGRKSGAVKAPPSGSTKAVPAPPPPGPKPVPKLVIKRPGEGATTAIPAVKPPIAAVPPVQPPKAPTPPPPPKAAEELPDLELIDLDLTPEPEPEPEPEKAPTPPPAPPKVAPPAPRAPVVPPPVAAAAPPPPKPPTPPPPASTPPGPVAPPAASPRVSMPSVPEPFEEEPEEMASAGGSKKGIIIGAILLLAAAGVGYGVLGTKKGAPVPVDTTSNITPPVAPVIDSTRHDSTAVGSTKRDSTAAPVVAAPVDTAKPGSVAVTPPPKPNANAPAPAAAAAAAGAIAPVPFAPSVARGPAPWTARPVVGAPLTIPTLEVVRLRYLAAQSRALDQFESGLQATGFTDLFDPTKATNGDRRSEAFDAIDAGRSALRDFRRRQTAIDFAYTDSMRQAMPPGSDTPDFRTFGPILRETPAQAALTDSLIGAVAEMYGMLTTEVGGYTFRGGMLTWKDADNAQRYQTLEEQLTSQIARIRNRAPSDVPPAMAATLRGIGLPR